MRWKRFAHVFDLGFQFSASLLVYRGSTVLALQFSEGFDRFSRFARLHQGIDLLDEFLGGLFVATRSGGDADFLRWPHLESRSWVAAAVAQFPFQLIDFLLEDLDLFGSGTAKCRAGASLNQTHR